MVEIPLPLCMDPTPKKLSIPLPFGGELKALLDMSKGPPNDCAIVHSLMLQITPMLASMECLLRILKIMKIVQEIVTAPVPVLKIPEKIPELIPAFADLADCFVMLTPPGLAKLIAAILRIIIAFLNCFIEAMLSILNFQVGIDLGSAQGNPVTLAALQCAQENSKKSLDGMMEAMGGAQPLMEIVQMLGKIVGLNFQLPSLKDIAGEPDALVALEKMRNSLVQIEVVIDALPV